MSRASFMDRLSSWWRRPAVRKRRVDACLEDPDGALAALQEEQGMIAQELEETFVAYDKKLRVMAERLADGDHVPTKKELARLQQEQLDLWRLVRRAQAAGRSTAALSQELREWRGRDSGAVLAGHPDHPETRAEIVASELRLRGQEVPEFVSDREDRTKSKTVVVRSEPNVISDVTLRAAAPSLSPDKPPNDSTEWVHDSDEHILRELASRERELTKLLRVLDSDPSVASEIALMGREIRELHAHLRHHDRRERRRRVRWEIGMPA